MVKTYKDLLVWQKAFKLTEEFFKDSKAFPKEELFILTSQMRRALISIISNIAEGYTRQTTADYLHFIVIAFGSATEFEVQLLLAKKLGYIDESRFEEINNLTTEVLKMLNALRTSLKGKIVATQ